MIMMKYLSKQSIGEIVELESKRRIIPLYATLQEIIIYGESFFCACMSFVVNCVFVSTISCIK